jgi:predicted nuclease of predicted toxin-antitoxin system
LKLRTFPFLADENIHPAIAGLLREIGCNVSELNQAGMKGADDLTVLRLAYTQKRVILTHDSDFGTLAIARGEPIIGIVHLRPGHINPRFTLETVMELLDRDFELTSPFIITAEHRRGNVRIRIRLL